MQSKFVKQDCWRALVALSCVVAACRPIKTDDSLTLSVEAENCKGPQCPTNADEFRKLFFDILCVQPGHAAQCEERARSQLLLPVDDQFLRQKGESLQQLDAAFKERSFSNLPAPGAPRLNHTDLAPEKAQKPIIMVLVPGLTSEFIRSAMYETIFKKYNSSSGKEGYGLSPYAKRWAEVAASVEPDSTEDLALPMDGYPKLDKPYEFAFKQTPTRMADVIDVTSIPKQGNFAVYPGPENELVRMVRLRSSLLSMETIGASTDSAKTFLRRLNKFFRAMDPGDANIVLVGYSRGAPIALDMLAMMEAAPATYPWYSKVRGLLTMGGVIFGTPDADDAFLPRSDPKKWDNFSQKELGLVRSYLFGDKDGPGLEFNLAFDDNASFANPHNLYVRAQNTMITVRNNWRWFKFFRDSLASDVLTADNSVPAQGDESTISSLKSSIESVYTKFTNLNAQRSTTDIKGFMRLAYSGFFNKFNLSLWDIQSVAVYNQNVYRFKRLLQACYDAGYDLQKVAREEWFKTHKLPTARVRYYALAASLDGKDPAPDRKFRDHLTYNSDTASGMGQLANHAAFIKTHGFQLNDGAVPVQRALFWPKVIGAANSANAGIRTTNLGIMGTHHWGLALPYTLAHADSNQVPEPYPHEELLVAFAVLADRDFAREP